MPTITQLEYALAVHREKHFGRAAEACHVSQPSLSTQIQKLEEELGVIIFDRSKKKIITTELGLAMIDQIQRVINEHKKLKEVANQITGEPRGVFKLAVIPTLSPYVIPLFVQQFSQNYPHVELIITENKTEDIIRLLTEDQIDAGLLVTPLQEETLIERHLFFEPFYVYVGEGHRFSNKKYVLDQELDESTLWLLEEGHCFRDQVLKICSLGRSAHVLPNVQFSSGNLETLKNLIKKSSGYTLLPQLAVEGLPEDERAHYVKKFKKPVPTREVSLVHSRSFVKETTINALEQTIIELLPKNLKSLKRGDLEVVDIY